MKTWAEEQGKDFAKIYIHQRIYNWANTNYPSVANQSENILNVWPLEKGYWGIWSWGPIELLSNSVNSDFLPLVFD